MSWGELTCKHSGSCQYSPTFETCRKTCEHYGPSEAERFRLLIRETIMQNKIRQARDKLQMTQVELAKALGVTSTTVARWERGEREYNNLTVLAVEHLVKERDGKLGM